MLHTDVCYVNAFKDREEILQQEFYHECWSYYSKYYHKLLISDKYKEDVFQDALLDFWNLIDAGTIKVENEEVLYCKNNTFEPLASSLLTFIMSMCRNRYSQYLRHYEVEISYEDLLDARKNKSSYETSNIETIKISQDNKNVETIIVDRCIEQLPNRCKDILIKFYYLNMSLDQILESRQESTSKDGLKVGKYKCMKSLESKIRAEYSNLHLKI